MPYPGTCSSSFSDLFFFPQDAGQRWTHTHKCVVCVCVDDAGPFLPVVSLSFTAEFRCLLCALFFFSLSFSFFKFLLFLITSRSVEGKEEEETGAQQIPTAVCCRSISLTFFFDGSGERGVRRKRKETYCHRPTTRSWHGSELDELVAFIWRYRIRHSSRVCVCACVCVFLGGLTFLNFCALNLVRRPKRSRLFFLTDTFWERYH